VREKVVALNSKVYLHQLVLVLYLGAGCGSGLNHHYAMFRYCHVPQDSDELVS
jgi:hypothetical protein